ncbi:protein TESPA1 [Elgaria multicarinata webbii]|uniref:protein TESPA1 n=1 Tax=Elgaria multicarinata webbii TaxID=159646 RepID=UPI002FCD0499
MGPLQGGKPTLPVGLPKTRRALPSARFSTAMDNFTSWLSQSSWERRHAWAKQRCRWHNVASEEEGPHASSELQPPYLENAFLQGSSSRKIESWLEECSSSAEPIPEGIMAPAAYGSCSNRTSFEDDLSLGAEAMLLLDKDRAQPRSQKGTLWPSQHLNMDHSMASSAISGSTNKTSSSISEVLDLCEVDAETILCNLGFMQEEKQAASWIPARFFSTPSQAQGINFQLFLRSQVQRIEMEDPCLMLATRFKQVQTLAVTADAFFCLYSYVSKTPVQKISPSHFFWASPEMPESWNVSSQPQAVTPLQRLQRAVSRMCLYTSPREGGSPWASNVPSPMSRLERIVWEVMKKAQKDRFHFIMEDMEEEEEGEEEEEEEAHMGSTEGPFCHSRMGSASSKSTVVEVTPMTSPCFCCEAPSHCWENTHIILPGLEPWLPHCTGGARLDRLDNVSYEELYHYGGCSSPVASSPDESKIS